MIIQQKYKRFILCMVSAALATTNFVNGADWTGFRGPDRDGKSAEKNLLEKWPRGGPRMLWAVQGLRKGYSSVAVANGMIYTTGLAGSEGILSACDLNGRLKWQVAYGPEWTGPHSGARSTPTVDEDRIYLISGMGQIHCFDARGAGKWFVDTFKTFGGRNLQWGIAESPLIVDEKIIVTPGGPEAAVVALDKLTGRTIWVTEGLDEKSAYCSPVLVEIGGQKRIVTMLEKSIVIINLENGELLCRIPHEVQYDISAVSPLFSRAGLYVTNGYGQGGVMYEILTQGKTYTQKWIDKTLDCHHGGVVLVDDNIYGMSSSGKLISLAAESGKVNYEDPGVGKGSIIYADGMLYCYEEKKGNVRLIQPAQHGFVVRGSFNMTQGDGEYWAHPAISDGVLYLRHGDALVAYDINPYKTPIPESAAESRYDAGSSCPNEQPPVKQLQE
ncbi:MAG: PQQ-binding-like beta-propeller repeat protein [Planctomycetota bacterium]